MNATVSMKDNIVYGGDVVSSVTGNSRSLGEFLLQQFKLDEDKIMMIDALTGHKYTRKEIYQKIVRLVYVLQKLDVKEGDVVGISAENRIEFFITLQATFAIGATLAPFNITYSERELHHAVNLSKPKIMFSSKAPLSKVIAVAKKNKFIKEIVAYDVVKSNSAVTSFSQLMDNKKIVSFSDFEPLSTDKNENVALIVCSSGTTGMPKGVQLTQRNILCTLDMMLDGSSIDMAGITVLSVIPWFHAFGCITLIVSSCKDCQFVFLPRFEEKIFLGAIEKFKVAMAFMVPPLMVFLAKHPIVSQYDLSSLLILLCGAAPLSKETEDAIKQRIGVPIIRQGYGLSESTLSLLFQDDTHCEPGSVGSVKPGTWAKVIDTETGAVLGPNQRGELCFKGDCIMKGYIGDTESTSNIIRDGWLHTGDIGYFSENFEFYIVDRIKELIKYKAFQVPPAEIEALLLTNPKIKDVAVIGKPDEASGELPMAFVVKQAGIQLSAEEVIKFVSDNASPAKRLRGGVRFVDEIPKNPSGKILRRVLRDMLKKPKSKL